MTQTTNPTIEDFNELIAYLPFFYANDFKAVISDGFTTEGNHIVMGGIQKSAHFLKQQLKNVEPIMTMMIKILVAWSRTLKKLSTQA